MQVVRVAVITLATATLLAAGDWRPGRRIPLDRGGRARRPPPVCGRRRPARAGVRRGRRRTADRARQPENRTSERARHRLRRAHRPRRDAKRALRRGLPRRPRPARRRCRARDDTRPPAAGDRGRGVSVRHRLCGDDGRRSRTHLGLGPNRPSAGTRRLDRPHGIVFDRAGDILVAEDSRRVRRIDPTTGRATLVVDGVDTNRIAVARDGTLFLAGGSPTGGSLRRLEPGGKPTILFEGPHVSDVCRPSGRRADSDGRRAGRRVPRRCPDRSPEEARRLEREGPPRGGPSQTNPFRWLSRRSRARLRAAAARRRRACSSRRRPWGTSPGAAPAAPP